MIGATFQSVNVNPNGKLGWSLAGGGTVDPAGSAYFAWAGYEQNGGAKGPVNLYISKSSNGGQTWTTALLDVSGAPQGANHAFPAIVAGAPGDVRISWMDTRAGSLWNTYY